MERRLGIGRRINFFRRLHGMTQKELGALLGFSEKSCDVRVAQYESGDRIPKEEMLQKLAAVFKISPLALKVPEIGSWEQRMHIFFAMEDMYGAKLSKIDGDYYLRIEKEDENEELVTRIRNAVLQEWLDKAQALEQGNLTKEAYDEWRYNYPKQGEYGYMNFRRDDIEESAYIPKSYLELLKLKKDVQQTQQAQTEKAELQELEQRYQKAEALIAKEIAALREEIEKLKENKVMIERDDM